MKVTQQSEPKFIPVVITLETQDEVDQVLCLTYRTGSPDGLTNRISIALQPHGDDFAYDLVSDVLVKQR